MLCAISLQSKRVHVLSGSLFGIPNGIRVLSVDSGILRVCVLAFVWLCQYETIFEIFVFSVFSAAGLFQVD